MVGQNKGKNFVSVMENKSLLNKKGRSYIVNDYQNLIFD